MQKLSNRDDPAGEQFIAYADRLTLKSRLLYNFLCQVTNTFGT